MSAITSQIVERHGMSKDGGKMFPMLVTVKVGVITCTLWKEMLDIQNKDFWCLFVSDLQLFLFVNCFGETLLVSSKHNFEDSEVY